MATAIKPAWRKPSTILFATEIPVNEKAFSVALAQAAEFGAELILFHACDGRVNELESSALCYSDYAAAIQVEVEHLEPLARCAREAGVPCEMVVRTGQSAEQIIRLLRERENERQIDRIVMGTHSPGPVGKLLVGSVAEAVLRAADVPLYVVGPNVVDEADCNFALRTILCGVSLRASSRAVARFAAEVAAEHNARLILQYVIRPQERRELLAIGTMEEVETEMALLIPAELQKLIAVQLIVAQGDPTEELLYTGKAHQTDLIVLGAQNASAFAAVARQGVVYQMLAHARCPVMTLSPAVLAACGAKKIPNYQEEAFLTRVF